MPHCALCVGTKAAVAIQLLHFGVRENAHRAIPHSALSEHSQCAQDNHQDGDGRDEADGERPGGAGRDADALEALAVGWGVGKSSHPLEDIDVGDLLGTLLEFLGGLFGGPYPCREERGEQSCGGNHPVVGEAVEEIQPVAAVGAVAEGLAERGVDPFQTTPVQHGDAGEDSACADDRVG